MSKKDVKASEKEQGAQSTDSVFDFLYHDSRRIASFLAQFSESGLLTGVRQGESAAKGAKRGWRVEAGGQVPLIGGGNLGLERSPGESGAETVERSYDPFWTNARFFLDVLDERGLIQRNLQTATVGQFVLVKGALIITDLQMMQAVWKIDTVKRYIKSTVEAQEAPQGIPGQKERSAKAKREMAANKPPSEADLVLELLPYFPHSSQLHIISGDTPVWATIEEGAMVGKVADHILKHGAKIAGEWAMLGILDGRPWEKGDLLTAMESMMVAGGETVSKVPLDLAPHIRMLLGRPLLSYAMTPLLVFREVA